MKREVTDTQPSNDRRSDTRFTVTIDIEWELNGQRHAGTISDLSVGGCFVLTGVEVEDGEAITLYLPIGDGMKVQYAGEITNHVHEIGFAAQFSRVSEAQRNILTSYLSAEKNQG
jgi:hypothetical protein